MFDRPYRKESLGLLDDGVRRPSAGGGKDDGAGRLGGEGSRRCGGGDLGPARERKMIRKRSDWSGLQEERESDNKKGKSEGSTRCFQ